MSRLRIRRRPVRVLGAHRRARVGDRIVVSSAVAAGREARAGYGTTALGRRARPTTSHGGHDDRARATRRSRLDRSRVIPSGALTEPPIAQVASAAILEGEAVVESRVAGHGMIPEGSIGIAVPLDAADLGAGSRRSRGGARHVRPRHDRREPDDRRRAARHRRRRPRGQCDALDSPSRRRACGFALSTAAVTVALLP